MHVAGTTCPEQYLHCLPVNASSVVPLQECYFHIPCYTLFDSYYCFFLIQTLIELFVYYLSIYFYFFLYNFSLFLFLFFYSIFFLCVFCQLIYFTFLHDIN